MFGDEFMVLFENVKSEQELRLILKTITKNIQWAFADRALYIAKAKGKNRYIIYDERKHGNIVTDREIQQNSGIRPTIVSDSRKSQIVQELFDEQGVYMESTMSRLKDSYKEAGRMYVSQENGKFFNRSPKLGGTDTGMVRIIGAFMAEVATE